MVEKTTEPLAVRRIRRQSMILSTCIPLLWAAAFWGIIRCFATSQFFSQHFIGIAWMFPILVLLTVAWQSWRERRLKHDVIQKNNAACFQCGYDLSGSVEERCSECGWEFHSLRAVRAFWQDWRPTFSWMGNNLTEPLIVIKLRRQFKLLLLGIGILGFAALVAASRFVTTFKAFSAYVDIFMYTWPVLVLLLLVWHGWRERRLKQEVIQKNNAACFQCGYDLSGSVEGQCPECGWEFGDLNRVTRFWENFRPIFLRRCGASARRTTQEDLRDGGS